MNKSRDKLLSKQLEKLSETMKRSQSLTSLIESEMIKFEILIEEQEDIKSEQISQETINKYISELEKVNNKIKECATSVIGAGVISSAQLLSPMAESFKDELLDKGEEEEIKRSGFFK